MSGRPSREADDTTSPPASTAPLASTGLADLARHKVISVTGAAAGGLAGGAAPDVGAVESALAQLPFWRLDADPENAERSLVRFTLSLLEMSTRLVEREALRRVDEGDLADEQVERIGLTLMRLEHRVREMATQAGVSEDDLRRDAGGLDHLVQPL